MSSPVILVAFSDAKPAQLLVSFLNSQHIQSSYVIVQGAHVHGVRVDDEDKVEQARTLAEEFVRNPGNRKYQQAAWSEGVPGVTERGAVWKNLRRPSFRAHPVTTTILSLCILVYVLSVLSGFVPVLKTLQITPLSELAVSHQWWRLLTPALLHFSLLHIVFNVLWWWILGTRIERTFGSSMLLLLFIGSALVSNLGQLWVSGPNFGGLSGVVYAVMGFVWWCGWLRPAWGLHLPPVLIGFMLIWMLLGFADALWMSTANTAHLMGLVCGCAAAALLHKTSKQA